MNRPILQALALAGLLAIVVVIEGFFLPPRIPVLHDQSVPAREKVYTLFFVGDIMLDRGVAYMVKTKGSEDWRFPFLHIADTLDTADFLFGNLESVVSDRGRDVGGPYSFRASPSSLEALTYAGFDVMSVANNHSLDYAVEALLDSIYRLEGVGILTAGGGSTRKEAHAPTLVALGEDTTIGILAYTTVGSPLWQARETSPGIAYINTDRLHILKEDIAAAKKLADIIIVSFHFGEEYQPAPNPTQRLIGETAITAGATLVVGHHPHVLQPLEQYKDGWIAWSLGNFLFDQYFSQETMRGAIWRVEIQDNKVMTSKLIPTLQNNTYQVLLDSEE
ncbi:MAG: CapA family protein [bacterium]|nr:CapA family protein [bacterium]